MELTSKIFEWLSILKARPKMIIGEATIDYRTLKIYVEGYVDGVGLTFDINLRKNISLWFQNKIKQQSSVYWTDQIANYYKNKTEEQIKEILLSTTEEYFKENTNWHNIAVLTNDKK